MKFSVWDYSQVKIAQFNASHPDLAIDPTDIFIFTWFKGFANKTRLKISKKEGSPAKGMWSKTIDGVDYFNVRYEAIIRDFPILSFNSVKSIQRRFDKYVSAGIFEKKIIYAGKKGNFAYFAFTDFFWSFEYNNENPEHKEQTKPVGVDNFVQTKPVGVDNSVQTKPLGADNSVQTKPLGVDNFVQTKPLGVDNYVQTKPLGVDNFVQTKPVGVDNSVQTKPLGADNSVQTKPLGVDNFVQTKPLGVDNYVQTKPLGVDNFVQTKPVGVDNSVQTKPLGADNSVQTKPLGVDNFVQTKPVGVDNSVQTKPLGADNSVQTKPFGVDNFVQTKPLGVDNFVQTKPLGVDNYVQTLIHNPVTSLNNPTTSSSSEYGITEPDTKSKFSEKSEEEVFSKTIITLFGYNPHFNPSPFPVLLSNFHNCNLKTDYLEEYLSWIFKVLKPKCKNQDNFVSYFFKSFVQTVYIAKFAYDKEIELQKIVARKTRQIVCPVCGCVHDKNDYFCPNEECKLSKELLDCPKDIAKEKSIYILKKNNPAKYSEYQRQCESLYNDYPIIERLKNKEKQREFEKLLSEIKSNFFNIKTT
ncbi:hypothetical protein [Treponema pectinovorum]|uniref:hypothetical protein n=1 Tax=Treponema pectinovorum TaxID=164 RepID=UPI0011F0EDDA|nr:hypothetical protein [Treponema pectinovorum]